MKYLSRILASNHRSDGIHVLYYSEAWGQGGVETFLMSIFRRWQGISVLTTTRAYNELEEEGFITSRQGKGFFVMSSGSNLIREQLIQEVEKNLNSAILAAERASMTDEELIKLLRLLLEVNHE